MKLQVAVLAAAIALGAPAQAHPSSHHNPHVPNYSHLGGYILRDIISPHLNYRPRRRLVGGYRGRGSDYRICRRGSQLFYC